MNDKYKVRVHLYFIDLLGRSYRYIYECQNVVGGLSELVYALEFDKDYFSYSYNYSQTELQFIKGDMKAILNGLTGNIYGDLNNRQQDKSYLTGRKIKVQVIDRYTNIIKFESELDSKNVKIKPTHIEVPLIQHSDLKEKLEKEISYSLEEIKRQVELVSAEKYKGNDIIEDVTLYGETYKSRAWGIPANLVTQDLYKNYYRVEQVIPVISQDGKIIAKDELWGALGGFSTYGTYDTLFGGCYFESDVQKTVKLKFNIRFKLARRRYVHLYFGQTLMNSYYYSPDNLSLFFSLKIGNSHQNRLIQIINVERIGNYDTYEWEGVIEQTLQIPANVAVYGEFLVRFTDYFDLDVQSLPPDSSIAIYGNPNWDISVLSNNAETIGSIFKCEVEIDGFANSGIHRVNDIYGIPIFDYLDFVSGKAGLQVDYSKMLLSGVQNICYSSQNLANFTKRIANEVGFLEIIEKQTTKNILDWLNTQFCLCYYVENNKIFLEPRKDYFLGRQQEKEIKANRLIEITPQNFIKTLTAGSKKYEISFASGYESSNEIVTWELKNTQLEGKKLDITCQICTDPQFIDWILVKKEFKGDKQFLIETYTEDGEKHILTGADMLICENITDGTIAQNYIGFVDRNFANVHLSPLAQIERWRNFITTPPQSAEYKIINSTTNYINIFKPNGKSAIYDYQKLYKHPDYTEPIFNNANTVVTGLIPLSKSFTPIKIRNFNQNGYLIPLKVKVETPIYDQFIGAKKKIMVKFDYNGRVLRGFPEKIETFFGYQTQEVEVLLANTSNVDNINDLIE
jgi:hypothetical protein